MSLSTNNNSNSLTPSLTTSNYRPPMYCSNNNKDNTDISNNYYSYDLVQLRKNDNYDGTVWSTEWKEAWNTTSYTLNIPTFCSSSIVNIFQPVMVMLPPDDDILCNPNLPIEIILEYQNYNQYYYYTPIAIVLPSLEVDRNNKTNNNTNNYNCTVDVIMKNIIEIMSYSNSMMYVFIPESYNNNNYYFYSNSSNATTDKWNNVNSSVDSGCTYPDNIIFSGAIIVDDTIINGITKDIINFRKKFGGNPRYTPTRVYGPSSSIWWFRMILMTDYNCDEQIKWDDYESFLGITDPNGGSYPTLGYGGSEDSTISTLSWLLPLFGAFLIGFCCWWYAAHEQSQREQNQNTTTTNHQGRPGSSSVTTTGAVAAGDQQQRNGQQQQPKKSTLTKDDFALLPQITYCCNKRQQSQQRIVPISSSITNTTTKTTSTGKLDIISESVDTPPSQDVIVENNNTITTTTTTIDGGITSINAISSNTITNNNIVDNTNKSLSHRSIGGNTTTTNNNTTNESSRNIIPNECCSICLDEFQENETLIALPRCIHFFHPHCIEEWLLIRKSASCPLCKTIILDQSTTRTITTTITTSEA